MSINLRTIAFTDVVSSTLIKTLMPYENMIARNSAFLEMILNPHRLRIEADLVAYGGQLVATAGDGCLLVFANATQAAQWAVAVQLSHVNNPIATPLGPVRVKIGMHTGTPVPDGTNYIGHEIDYAARIIALAKGGQIMLSEVMAMLVRDARIVDVSLRAYGEHNLEGVGFVPVFELLYGGCRRKRSKKLRGRPQIRGDRDPE